MRLVTMLLIVTASVVLMGQSETVYLPGNGVSLPSVVKQVKGSP